MQQKIIGIFVCMLLFSIAVLPVTGLINNVKNKIDIEQITEEGLFYAPHGNHFDFLPFDYPISFEIKTPQFEQSEHTILKKEPSTFDSGILEVVSSESDGDSQASSIAIGFEGTIHVAWCDNSEYEEASDGGLYDIFYKFKPIGGEWSATEVVTPESSIYNNIESFIDVDSHGNVHVVWWIGKNDDNYYPICYKMKPKDGNWSDTEFVPLNSFKNCVVHLNIDFEDNVHVVWTGGIDETSEKPDLFYNMKLYNDTWSTSELVSIAEGFCGFPHIATDPEGSVHVTWMDDGNFQIPGFDFDLFYKMKPKDGEWSATEVVSTESPDPCLMSHIAIGSDGNIHVSWSESNLLGTSCKIYYRMKSNSGSWSDKEEIAEKCLAYTSWLFIDEYGTVHLVFDVMFGWAYNPNNPSIFYRRKLDDGSWSRAEMISVENMLDDMSASGIPRIAVENNNLHFVWTGDLNYSGCGEDWDIFYKMKTIDDNQHPEKPTISGPRFVKYDSYVNYTFYTTDPEGDDLYYCVWLHSNLGLLDSFLTPWMGPYASGEEFIVDIPFFSMPGISWVKAKAVDANGGLSDVETFTVIVYKSRTSHSYNFLSRFLEQFPALERILSLLIH